MSYTINLMTRNQTTGALNRTDISSNVLTGFSFVEKLDNSLDIGTIIVRGLTTAAPYTMFDSIEVKYGSTVLYSQRIAGDNVRLISKNPLRYEHTLSLVEHTKVLELFLISSKTFTQPTDGSVLYTLADVIQILNKTTPLELESLVNSTRVFKFDNTNTYYDLFDGIESPEFTFNDLTLRDALNQVCDYIDAIPRLFINDSDELELTFDFVSELKNLITDENVFVNRELQQNIDFYSTNIESETINLVNDSDVNESVEIYPSKGAFISGRSDSYIYNFLDSYMPSPKNIFNVPTLLMKPTNIVVTEIGVDDVYIASEKYNYYAELADFPTIGKSNLFYVDIADSEKVYTWNGSTYIVSTGATTNTFPKIRFCSSTSTFGDTDTTGRALDIFIARDTGYSYRWSTTYIQLQHIDSDGELMLDLYDRILEQQKYNQNDVDSEISAIDRINPTKYYQCNTLYYVYKEKKIPLGNTTGIWNTDTTIEIIAKIKAFEMLQDDGIIPSGDVYTQYSTSIGTAVDDYLYQLQYIPIPDSVRLSISRQDISDVKYNSALLSNQQGRIVNLEQFTNNLQGRINRIGNSELQLENRSTNIDDLYNIGDYTNDLFIITDKETIFYKDYIYATYGLTKNFNKISSFIGVNSEIRQWEISEKNTLQRKINYEEYIEIDVLSSGTGSDSSKLIQTDGVKTFIRTFDPSSVLEPVRGSIIDSSETTKDYLLDMSSNGGGNSLIFDFQINSNQVIGSYRDEINSQVANNFHSYVDDLGNMEYARIYCFDRLYTKDITQDESLSAGDNYPLSSSSHIVTELIKNDTGYRFNTIKDNREELGGTLQFKFISLDTQNVILGRLLSRRNRLVNEQPPTQIKLYTYDTEKFSRTDNLTVKSGYDTVATVATTSGLTGLTIDDTVSLNVKVIHSNLTSSKSSWALTDENDKILIAVNQDGTKLDTITFDFVNKRSGINYKY